jgi:hypothetical protein
MKIFMALVLSTYAVSAANAQTLYGTGSNPDSHYVAPHVTSQGNYVQGHYRTNPNQTTTDNYSAPGNYNPHTGRVGGQRGSRYGNW